MSCMCRAMPAMGAVAWAVTGQTTLWRSYVMSQQRLQPEGTLAPCMAPKSQAGGPEVRAVCLPPQHGL